MPWTILVIDDDEKLNRLLKRFLGEFDYIVYTAIDAQEGLKKIRATAPDLIILDVELPGRDGWSVLSAIRQTNRQTPVVFLTARDAVPDRVKGLELGADDYLVKPFAFSELLARVRTILRRRPNRQAETLEVADLKIDLLRHRATRDGRRLELSPKEFGLLALLTQRQGEVLSRTLIAEQVWDIHFDSDTNVVDVAVRRLRRKVDDPFPLKIIHTVRGFGYVLEER